MAPIKFSVEKKIPNRLGRAGILECAHGTIQTPAFVTVGTKATVKALTPEQVKELGAEVVLANTYHLYLEPGDALVKTAGGLQRFMHWEGPTMTDSGGFQVFSLGAAYGKSVSKIADARAIGASDEENPQSEPAGKLVKIDNEGVTFKSVLDGSTHRFTPERSVEIQHNIGADMIFAFDECTSPSAPLEYQREAMERTHRWAKRSLDYHESKDARKSQALFGIVQGGRFEDLRKESAKYLASMNFDGFGIGGSFNKDDMYDSVEWVNGILPEDRPRHLLGIGEPADLLGAIENGCDLFDCVAPTRMARNGALYTLHGKINISNARFTGDFTKIDEKCACYTCTHYTKAYLSHLFRAREMLAATLASIHNLYFIVNMVKKIRKSVLDGTFTEFRESFLAAYQT
ncbi:MAG: tRNA guanosine(34) transglycosylase Tgt [bacterium]|nr:tRNA guanosine(34) transglycosylase Tgt [bacterium]